MTDSIEVVKYAPVQLSKLAADPDSIEGKQISATITSYGNADIVKDVIKEGALTDFISTFDGRLPMMLQHNQAQIIGVWKQIYTDGSEVKANGELFDTNLGQDVQMLLKERMYSEVSIGFQGTYTENEQGGRDFEKIDLFETSIVFRGANPKAQITSVKDEKGRIDVRKLEKALRDVGVTQKERKLILAGGVQELMKQRDVLDVEHQKQQLVTQLLGVLK